MSTVSPQGLYDTIQGVEASLYVIKLYPTLCDPMDSSLPGASVHGDLPGNNTGVDYCAFL